MELHKAKTKRMNHPEAFAFAIQEEVVHPTMRVDSTLIVSWNSSSIKEIRNPWDCGSNTVCGRKVTLNEIVQAHA
jgi:hypothetical protein